MTQTYINRQSFPDISGLTGNLQIFDLKQLADIEAAYKQKCLQAFAAYRAWGQSQSDRTDTIERLYGTLEGTLLRRQAENTVQAYWIIRRDFRAAFQTYLIKNCCYKPSVKQAA